MITICFTYFKSLALANFEAALASLRWQDLTQVYEIVIVDNDTASLSEQLQDVIDSFKFPVPVRLRSFKHGDPTKTHSWSTNMAVQEAKTTWVLFTRADYILDRNLVAKFETQRAAHRFITSVGYHVGVDVGRCDETEWRKNGASVLRSLPGSAIRYTPVDSGVWMTTRELFDKVGGLDEDLSAWGHAQTYFQHKLHLLGVEFVNVPETLFYHPLHAAERDIDLAHQQLRDKGVSLQEMWKRHNERVY